MNSVSAMQSALSLVQLGSSKMLDAVQFLGSENPDYMIDGFVSMQQAKNAVRTGIALMHTQQEMDDAILDILA